MTLRILVAAAFPGRQDVIELTLPEGATVRDALEAAGLRQPYAAVGIWSRLARAETLLRDNDRVEIYRALKADAKALRRARARLRPASPRSRNEP